MALGSALKKITTRAKQIRKKAPGKSWKSAIKQAGSEYRGGKLKKRRKVSKVGAVKKTKRRSAPRKRSAKRRSASKPVVRTRTLTVVKYRTRTVRAKRRSVARVGKSGGKGLLLLGIGVLLVGGYMLMKKSAPAAALIPRTNPATNSTAANIVAIAQAAGIVGTQLQNIISKLNSSSDASIQQAYSNLNAGGGIDPSNPTAFIAGY